MAPIAVVQHQDQWAMFLLTYWEDTIWSTMYCSGNGLKHINVWYLMRSKHLILQVNLRRILRPEGEENLEDEKDE